MRPTLALLAALLVAATIRADDRLVKLDVVVMKGPASMKNAAVLKAFLPTDHSAVRVASSAEAADFLQAMRTKAGGKLVGEPMLLTQSGQPCRYESGGERLVLTSAGMQATTVGFRLQFTPTILADGRINVEMRTGFRAVNGDRAVKTPAGMAPGLDEPSTMASSKMAVGNTLVLVQCNEHSCDVIAVTPSVVNNSFPVDRAGSLSKAAPRTAGVVAKLIAKYHESCRRGDLDQAREFAQMALELDPACFANHVGPVPAAVPATVVAPDGVTPILSPVPEGQSPPSLEEPTGDDVIRVLKHGGLANCSQIDIVCEKLVDRFDPPRLFPLVGYARLHHGQWKCTAYFSDSTDSASKRQTKVVYLDKNALHRHEVSKQQ